MNAGLIMSARLIAGLIAEQIMSAGLIAGLFRRHTHSAAGLIMSAGLNAGLIMRAGLTAGLILRGMYGCTPSVCCFCLLDTPTMISTVFSRECVWR